MIQEKTIRFHHEDAFGTPPMPDEHPFWISQYGHTFADGDYHEFSYKSDVTRIEYVIDGRGVINSQDRSCIVSKGDTYILHQGENHNCFSDMKNPMDKIWVNVTGPMVEEMVKLFGLEQQLLFKEADASPYIYRMHEICRRTQDPYEIQAKGSGAFCELIQFLARQKKTDAVSTGDFADDMRTYIDLHIEDEITIEDLCGVSQKSPNQTIRLFKQKFGITPHQYILRLKFTAACTMLQSSNLSVEKIAQRLNYQSVGYFSNFFYSFNGMRPSEYRRLHRSSVKQT